MAFFDFGSGHEVGVGSIDQQHRGLVERINRIHGQIAERAPIADLQEQFERLYRETERHFLHEEALFAPTQFERAERHKKEHGHLLLILKRFRQTLNPRELSTSTVDHVAFLRAWLVNHIANEDRPLGEYLKSLETR
jgi:hemerythrin